MRAVRSLTTVLLLVLIAGACSSTPNTEDETAPFDAVLLQLFDTTDTEAYLAQAEHAAAGLVVECMNDAGFDFVIDAEPAPTQPDDETDIDVAREAGFGIISGFRQQVADLNDDNRTAEQQNVAYLGTLPSSEIDRFFLALDGEEPEPGQRQENGGCNGAASTEAYADWLRFFEALPNYTAMGEERDTHPDWLAARALWRACMVDRGLDYAEPDVIRSDVVARMRATVDEIYPERQVPVVESGEGYILDPVVDDLLAELEQFELEAAVANIECTEPIADQFAAVEHLVQQGFVERNQVAIDELLAAAG